MLKRLKQLLWLVLGHCFLAIGLIGVFLPVLPTIPFVVIASGCYAKGSEKFHQRLRNDRWFGAVIKDWEDRRAISFHSKWVVVASLTISVVSAVVFLSALWIKIGIGIVAIGAALFVVTKPTAKSR